MRGKCSVSVVKTEEDRAVWLQRILKTDLLEFSTRTGYYRVETELNRIASKFSTVGKIKE